MTVAAWEMLKMHSMEGKVNAFTFLSFEAFSCVLHPSLQNLLLETLVRRPKQEPGVGSVQDTHPLASLGVQPPK